MKTSVLITGYRGFVGSALVAAFGKKRGLRVIGVSRSEGCDLSACDVLRRLPRVDRIVHLAGSVGVVNGWARPHEMYENNLLSTLHVLEHARARCTPVIYMSSYVYGEPACALVDESHPVNCRSPYARSKRLGEMLCEGYSRDFGIPVTVLRPFNLYGPGQSDDSLVATVVRQAVAGRCIQIRDLRPRRDYLHIGDLADAVMRVLARAQTGFTVFNIGYGRSHSVKEVIDIVATALGRRIPVKCSAERRRNEIPNCVSDSSRFRRRYGWKPRIALDEGIRLMLEHGAYIRGEIAGRKGHNDQKRNA